MAKALELMPCIAWTGINLKHLRCNQITFCACDMEYLHKTKDLISSHIRYRIKTHLLIGIFIDKSVDDSWETKLQKLSNNYIGTSISFIAFSSESDP